MLSSERDNSKAGSQGAAGGKIVRYADGERRAGQREGLTIVARMMRAGINDC